MTGQYDETAEEEPNSDAQDDTEEEDMLEDVDHTHPDTEESFAQTGVYDRGKKRSDDDNG